ncbi:stage III sporulation protein AF [Marininema mesophilum]|uniref:Stage III sporulation protein AF n=1 Tax=Marininema mesophilum TaxID=1048340 RepID=A0A1H2UB26_9BACL|nr:stage III sporulation protein AF [Marininema mesophilum]
MIELVADWLKPIIILVILATFMDLLLPHNGMERYVKLVMGLLIIMAILSPILQFLQKDIQLSDLTLDNQIRNQEGASLAMIKQDGRVMEKKQEKLVQKEVEKKMALTIQQNVERRFKLEVTGVTVKTNTKAEKEPSIVKIILHYRKQEKPKKSTQVKQVDEIKPVHIGVSGKEPNQEKPKRSKGTDALSQKIGQYLSETWRLSPDQTKIVPEPEA